MAKQLEKSRRDDRLMQNETGAIWFIWTVRFRFALEWQNNLETRLGTPYGPSGAKQKITFIFRAQAD
jgi:hypothetical protein